MTGDRDRVTLYRDKRGEWRWQRVAPNGVLVGAATQGYERQIDAVGNLERLSTGAVLFTYRLWVNRPGFRGYYRQGLLMLASGANLRVEVIPS